MTGYKEKLHTKIIRVLIPLFVYIPVSLLSAVSFTIILTLLSSVLKAAGLSGISEADMLMWVNALSSLPEMEQEMIFLYYFQRLTHKEIGEQYGRTRSTTGRRIRLILQQLRAELEGAHHEPATPL